MVGRGGEGVGMFVPVAYLMSVQHGLISSRQALEAGLAPQQLARLVGSGAWVRLRRGIFADAEVWAGLDEFYGRPLLRIRAAMMTLQCDHVLSHDSAGVVQRMWVPDTRESLVHITRRKVHGDAVRAGVKHHLAPYRDDEVVEVDGLRVLNPARTALDLGREHGLVAGVAGVTSALRAGVTRDDLSAARARMWCWPESRVLDQALDIADPGSESYLECEALAFVAELGLGLGRPQTQLGLSDGHRTVWCDIFLCRHVFEVDGKQKYRLDNLQGRDPGDVLWAEKRRQDFISGFKLGVSRITTHDCRAGRTAALRRVAREFEDTCRRFGTDPTDLAPYIVTGRVA
jgi:hypothetical protein